MIEVACRTDVIFLRFAGEREGEREAEAERVSRASGLASNPSSDSRSALASALAWKHKIIAPVLQACYEYNKIYALLRRSSRV